MLNHVTGQAGSPRLSRCTERRSLRGGRLGDRHPDTLSSINNLAALLSATGAV